MIQMPSKKKKKIQIENHFPKDVQKLFLEMTRSISKIIFHGGLKNSIGMSCYTFFVWVQ